MLVYQSVSWVVTVVTVGCVTVGVWKRWRCVIQCELESWNWIFFMVSFKNINRRLEHHMTCVFIEDQMLSNFKSVCEQIPTFSEVLEASRSMENWCFQKFIQRIACICFKVIFYSVPLINQKSNHQLGEYVFFPATLSNYKMGLMIASLFGKALIQKPFPRFSVIGCGSNPQFFP